MYAVVRRYSVSMSAPEVTGGEVFLDFTTYSTAGGALGNRPSGAPAGRSGPASDNPIILSPGARPPMAQLWV